MARDCDSQPSRNDCCGLGNNPNALIRPSDTNGLHTLRVFLKVVVQDSSRVCKSFTATDSSSVQRMHLA